MKESIFPLYYTISENYQEIFAFGRFNSHTKIRLDIHTVVENQFSH